VEAESKVGRALDKWSEEARLTLSSVKPDRVASDKGLKEMTFVVVGTGTLDAVARFLWKVETASLPIKVKDMQLGSSNESGQSMSVQLRLSALCLGAEQKPPEEKPLEVNNEEQA
jgi:Tfp pilus assembly protein PilO